LLLVCRLVSPYTAYSLYFQKHHLSELLTVNEIVRIIEENGYDLTVMASSRISSSVRLLGSTTKGVIDSIRKPVLIIHE
jgi:nucleotide-binding universal stress UspA family protein